MEMILEGSHSAEAFPPSGGDYRITPALLMDRADWAGRSTFFALQLDVL